MRVASPRPLALPSFVLRCMLHRGPRAGARPPLPPTHNNNYNHTLLPTYLLLHIQLPPPNSRGGRASGAASATDAALACQMRECPLIHILCVLFFAAVFLSWKEKRWPSKSCFVEIRSPPRQVVWGHNQRTISSPPPPKKESVCRRRRKTTTMCETRRLYMFPPLASLHVFGPAAPAEASVLPLPSPP